ACDGDGLSLSVDEHGCRSHSRDAELERRRAGGDSGRHRLYVAGHCEGLALSSVLLRYVTTICSPSNTPPSRKLREPGSCCRTAWMAWMSPALGASYTTIFRTARRVLMTPAAALACAWSLPPAPCGTTSTWKPPGDHASGATPCRSVATVDAA